MKRILFVDDEPLVLGGLRDMLRRQRKHWDMVFALGGQAALDLLAVERFDVVVSDMRMPGIDGVTLLRSAKANQPGIVRIILSGHAEREAVFNALPVAHQFLSKPCDTEVLRDVVERACALRTLLQDDQIRTAIGTIERLPSAAQLCADLTQAAARSDVGLAEFASIVEQDPAMAAKVLQLVNSSFFGLARRQTCLWEAVSYLGTELSKDLALSAPVFEQPKFLPIPGFSLERSQRHALLTARIAQRLLPDKKLKSEAYTAALLHDVGKLVFAVTMPERFAEVLRVRAETGRFDHVVETELLGVTHAEAGAYLMALWGLPLSLVEVVANHHRPEAAAPSDVLVAVHAASALAHVGRAGTDDPTCGGRLNVEYVADSSLGPELPHWRELAEVERRRATGEV